MCIRDRTATLLVGLLFLLMSLFHIRETVVKHMPRSLQNAISAGIGLFIASIGLKNAGIIVANDTSLIALGNLSAPAPLLACFGLCITSILLVRKVPMALLFGIAITTILGFFVGVTKMPTAIFSAPPSLTPTFLHFDFSHLFSWDMLFVVFAFAMVGIFNTAGTLIGFATKSGWMDENNELPVAKKALLSDAVGTTVGACLGTSTLTIFAESASGIAAGGKTGLTALTAALCLILAVFLSPLILIVPNAATGPALVLVGVFMASPLANIDFVDYSEGIPAFLTAVMMPFTSSLADGIGIGVIAYCILKLTGGPKLRQDLNPMILTFALLFVLKYLFL